MKFLLTFVFTGFCAFLCLCFVLSPFAEMLKIRKYYPRKYRKQYYKHKSKAFFLTPLLFYIFYILLRECIEETEFIWGFVFGCVVALIITIIDIITPKGPMGIITDENTKELYLEYEDIISSTNDFSEKNDAKEIQRKIFDYYLKRDRDRF